MENKRITVRKNGERWQAEGFSDAAGKTFVREASSRDFAVEAVLNTLCVIEEYGPGILDDSGRVDAKKLMEIEKRRIENGEREFLRRNRSTEIHKRKFAITDL